MKLVIIVLALFVTLIRAADLTADQIESFRTAFDTFDEEKVGSVSKDSIAEILEVLEIPYDSDSLSNIVNEFDENQSGRFEFDEFVKLLGKIVP